jgi:hypothetical protein
MRRVRLIHWKAEEARERVAELQAAGYEVDYDDTMPSGLMKRLRERPPAAVAIDLTRLPSHGREVATAIRSSKSTRGIPLVFAGGEPEKVEKMRALLPDAVFTEWARIRGALKRAIAHAPLAPVAPPAMMDRYAGTPLVKKLGIAAGMKVALVDAPDGFERTLGDVPDGVEFDEGMRGGCGLAIWFVRSGRELDTKIGRIAAATPEGGIWIAYPKKASGVATDLTQQMVREAGLAHGIVDYKVCAIDATWTGLKFARRRERR